MVVAMAYEGVMKHIKTSFFCDKALQNPHIYFFGSYLLVEGPNP